MVELELLKRLTALVRDRLGESYAVHCVAVNAAASLSVRGMQAASAETGVTLHRSARVEVAEFVENEAGRVSKWHVFHAPNDEFAAFTTHDDDAFIGAVVASVGEQLEEM